jgi:AraC-like DNA-binding protein
MGNYKNLNGCSVCTHPDRATIDEQLLAGSSYSDIARRFDLNISPVSNHYRKHTGATVQGPAQTASVQKVRGHLADLEARLKVETNEDRKLKLLMQRGRAITALTKVLGDSIQSTVTTFAQKLGFNSPDELAAFVAQARSATSGGTPQALALAQRLLVEWNQAHPNAPREVRMPRRTRYPVPGDAQSVDQGMASSGAPNTQPDPTR